MLVPLTTADATAVANSAAVGGKASSLAKLYAIPALQGHVPKSYALSTAFFRPWVDALLSSQNDEYAQIVRYIVENDPSKEKLVRAACDKLKQACLVITLNASQKRTLGELSAIVASEFDHGLAAVRSSGIEEDGADQSYAGMFETRLGVAPSGVERAVRECFASRFDYRVFRYAVGGASAAADLPGVADATASEGARWGGGFALVVMEMVDSAVAGVAFSANPLNSDRDECVVDSSYGLGESVVDGSVTADRFIYDKVHDKLVDEIIGSKKLERRLNMVEGGGVTVNVIDDEDRRNACSLSEEWLKELVRLTCIVEKEYGTPMDIEWACTDDNEPRLVLLQARPITTLFSIDSDMMTEPGEKRVLYYDFNIASEATTTTPFRHMDMSIYCRVANIIGGMPEIMSWPKDPNMPMFNASTRQYVNFSIFLKYFSTDYCSRESELLDPYLSSLFGSKDCDRNRYRMKKLPKGVNMKNMWWLFRQFPMMKYYKIGKESRKDPERAKEKYLEILNGDMSNLAKLKERGWQRGEGLQKYSDELFRCLMPSATQEMGLIMFVLIGIFRQLDKERREGETEEVRADANSLCGGYEGDELMQINIALYNLANMLEPSIWEQYRHDELHSLANRIQENLDGTLSDLPNDFLSEWKIFMERYGWDGEDQMFISSPRYQDDPVLLLARLRPNVGLKDPALTQKKKASKRRQTMKSHEDRTALKRIANPFGLSRIRKRNLCLEHLMWIRNSPKLHFAAVMGVLRTAILQAEQELIMAGRLDAKNDVFHLDLEEVDKALSDENYDLIKIVRPRKVVFERAIRAKECPLLIDSRCRILRPDPPSQEDVEEGVIVGAAVSPGTATGKVRIMRNPTDQFEQGEILAATVTSPAWTPLFVGASAVILQIGGALQHGALCAREFGKPAVSNIDIHNILKTGMTVIVDGNVGTVTVATENNPS